MKSKNTNKQQKQSSPIIKKAKLPELELSNKPTVIISPEVQNQILYFHSVVKQKEWSGYLLCEQQGSIQDLNNLVLTCKHIHLLDIGTATYTEFGGETFNEVLDDIGDTALEYKVHKIHSHNSMKCFHSTTDMDDLHDNAENFPFLLSLIVNFEGTYDAKIAFIGTQGTPEKIVLNSRLKGEDLVLNAKDKEVLVLCNCNIVIQTPEYNTKRINKILASKEKAQEKLISTSPEKQFNLFNEEKYFGRFDKPQENHGTLDLNQSKIDKFLINLITLNPASNCITLYEALNDTQIETQDVSPGELDVYLETIDDNFQMFAEDEWKIGDLSIFQGSRIANTCIKRLHVYEDIPIVNNILKVLDIWDLEEANVIDL